MDVGSMRLKASRILLVLFLLLIVLVLLSVGIVVYLLLADVDSSSTDDSVGTVSVASWNLQNFGPVKAGNESLLNFYAEKLACYDVFVIQEIQDPTSQAVESLARKLPSYDYVISSPAGRGSSKEQYAIFYNTKVVLVDTYDWTKGEQDDFERPPFEATFRVKNWTFTLFTIHVKVDDVAQELFCLETLLGSPTQDTILIGDLNADGDNYYDGVLHHFLDWQWVITSAMDTTVSKSSNAYDRIIINEAAKNNFLRVGIMNDVDGSQSDHYLVYAVFDPNKT
jgi:endonuclease/exonuclease/phosphatase family metal-dependent hydrolase